MSDSNHDIYWVEENETLRTENARLKQELEQLHKDAKLCAEIVLGLRDGSGFYPTTATYKAAERILKGGGDE